MKHTKELAKKLQLATLIIAVVVIIISVVGISLAESQQYGYGIAVMGALVGCLGAISVIVSVEDALRE